MLIGIVLVVFCTIVEGLLWYESEDDANKAEPSSNTSSPQAAPANTSSPQSAPSDTMPKEVRFHENGGYTKGDFELQEVCGMFICASLRCLLIFRNDMCSLISSFNSFCYQLR